MNARPFHLALCLCVAAAPAAAQDTLATPAAVSRDSLADSTAPGRMERLRRNAQQVGGGTVALARRGAHSIFTVDSTVEQWTRRGAPTSGVMRYVAGVAFWVPVAAVVTPPLVWADEARDGNHLNAQYARTATTALAMGFVASRTVKHFVRRTRPCGLQVADTSSAGASVTCAGTSVRRNASFFSEHTMAVFALASAATFQAQRQLAPNANTIALVSFTAATGLGLARIYQRHHWLSDVVVGAAVGTVSGYLSAQLSTR